MIKAALSMLFRFLNSNWTQDFYVSPPSKKRVFNGRLPSVKQQQRKASKVAASRRARKLGHA
jgi:hypothetical protein